PEVAVTGVLEARVGARFVPLADVPQRPVEVGGVLVEEVMGGEVRAAPKPGLRPLLDEAKVGVNGGDQRVARMQNEAQSAGEKLAPLSAQLQGEGLAQLSPHPRNVDASLLKDAALLENAGPSPATPGALPAVVPEAALPVFSLQRAAQLLLQALDEGLHPRTKLIHRLHRGRALCCKGECAF